MLTFNQPPIIVRLLNTGIFLLAIFLLVRLTLTLSQRHNEMRCPYAAKRLLRKSDLQAFLF
jgi:hypothetical protein